MWTEDTQQNQFNVKVTSLGRFTHLHEGEQCSARDEVLLEELGAGLAVSEGVDEELGGVTDAGVGLGVVSVIGRKVAHQKDVVPKEHIALKDFTIQCAGGNTHHPAQKAEGYFTLLYMPVSSTASHQSVRISLSKIVS